MSAKEIVNDLRENYVKVRKLLEEDSKNDPDDDPYLSKYKAIEILNTMRDVLRSISESESGLNRVQIDALTGAVLLSIGNVDMDTENLAGCDEALTEALDILLPSALEPEIIVILVSVQNVLGLLWSYREEPERAKLYLLSAKKHCEDFKATLQMPVPVESILNIVPPSEEEATVPDLLALEKAYTLTLYYLAQVYGTLKENLKSAVYCHATLRRQLVCQDFEAIDWALNCATLSQVFVEQDGFYQCRYHLAAASTILDEFGEELCAAEINLLSEVFLAKQEELKHRKADVARCWIKYCLMLMSASKARLMKNVDVDKKIVDAVTDMSNLKLEDDENICGGDIRQLVFPDLDVSKYEEKVSDKFLLTYEDAREVFKCCQGWIKQAKDYYRIDTLASDHVELVQDSSQAYMFLAFFEEDDERRAKMHKRRVDILKGVLEELNPTYYLHYCKQLWFELGEVYSEILNVKLEKYDILKEESPQHLKNKINMLCEKSMEYFGKFLDSLKDKNGVMPTKLNTEDIRLAINALACSARSSMKRIPSCRIIRLSHMQQSCDFYQEVVNICMKDREAAKLMYQEFVLCRNMANILPLQIYKLQNMSQDNKE